jgi:aspartate/methionine/tyrosine aminotransferase
MVAEFRARRDLVIEGLNELPGVVAPLPAGAFYAFPDVSGTGLSAQTLADRLLEEAGVSVLAGTAFGRHAPGCLRVSYATSQAELRRGLERIADFLAANGLASVAPPTSGAIPA